jgi:hypothetical protein
MTLSKVQAAKLDPSAFDLPKILFGNWDYGVLARWLTTG